MIRFSRKILTQKGKKYINKKKPSPKKEAFFTIGNETDALLECARNGGAKLKLVEGAFSAIREREHLKRRNQEDWMYEILSFPVSGSCSGLEEGTREKSVLGEEDGTGPCVWLGGF
jgi:hypothetical protein